MENNETKTKEQCKVVRELFGGVPVSVRCTDDSLDEQAEVNTSVLYFYLIRSGKRTERTVSCLIRCPQDAISNNCES